MMGSMMPMIDTSMLQFVLIAGLLFAIPAGLVLKRIGFSMWWALLCFVPIAALLGLWALAFVRWTPSATE
jgi:hypothetical protein